MRLLYGIRNFNRQRGRPEATIVTGILVVRAILQLNSRRWIESGKYPQAAGLYRSFSNYVELGRSRL
jgi:hypothetical protein